MKYISGLNVKPRGRWIWPTHALGKVSLVCRWVTTSAKYVDVLMPANDFSFYSEGANLRWRLLPQLKTENSEAGSPLEEQCKRKSSRRQSSILKARRSPLKVGTLEDIDPNSLDDNGRSPPVTGIGSLRRIKNTSFCTQTANGPSTSAIKRPNKSYTPKWRSATKYKRSGA